MSILVDMDNQIIPSPSNAIQRMKLKEEVFHSQLELDKRLSILEHHVFTMIRGSSNTHQKNHNQTNVTIHCLSILAGIMDRRSRDLERLRVDLNHLQKKVAG